jgi:hypothetical protein
MDVLNLSTIESQTLQSSVLCVCVDARLDRETVRLKKFSVPSFGW